jgi:hypothetical protein
MAAFRVLSAGTVICIGGRHCFAPSVLSQLLKVIYFLRPHHIQLCYLPDVIRANDVVAFSYNLPFEAPLDPPVFRNKSPQGHNGSGSDIFLEETVLP